MENTDTLTPEFQSLINSVNQKKNTITTEFYADFDLKKSEDLMSSREFITKENAGPREVIANSEECDESEDMDHAREYILYEGRVEPLYGKFKLVKKVDEPIVMKNNKTITKRELDMIIEDKINEIINEEIQYQKNKQMEEEKLKEQEKLKEEQNLTPGPSEISEKQVIYIIFKKINLIFVTFLEFE